jgi:hypothetical protein
VIDNTLGLPNGALRGSGNSAGCRMTPVLT